MVQKIEKLKAEREKNTAKIEGLQSRNKEIDAKITEIENLNIIGIVRENSVTPEKLSELIHSMKEKGAANENRVD